MADFNALEALINAYIKQNGVQAITGQVLNGVLRGMVSALGKGWTVAGEAYPNTDPGTMTGPVAYVAHTAGTYTNFGGLVVNDGEVAFLKYNEQTWTKEVLASLAATASVDGNVGTPYVETQFVNGVLNFAFHNVKGDPGINGTDGQDGDAAGFGTVSASVDNTVGTPAVSVQSSGPNTAKNFAFSFTGLKGETGVTSVVVTVDNTSGTPQCTASLNSGVLTLAFTGLKGQQGDTGSSVDYPFTIVNNLTTNDATKALSAAQGVQLESEISQLEAELNGINVSYDSSILTNGAYIDSSDGTEKANGYRSRTDYVEIEPGAKLVFKVYGSTNPTNQGYALYDANKQFVSGVAIVNAIVNTITIDAVPASVKYIRISFVGSSNQSFGLFSFVETLPGAIDGMQNEIDDIQDDIADINTELEDHEDRIDALENADPSSEGLDYILESTPGVRKVQSDFTTTGLWKSALAEIDASYVNYRALPLIDVVEGQIIKFHNWQKGNIPTLAFVFCYDNDGLPFNGNDARRDYQRAETADYVNGNYTFKIPSNCSQIGLSYNFTAYPVGDDAYVEISEPKYEFTDEAKEMINNAVEQGNEVGDDSAKYYLKGNSNIVYSPAKKLGIIAAGQSNIDGRNSYSDLPSGFVNPNDKVRFCNNTSGTFADFQVTDGGQNNDWSFDAIVYDLLTKSTYGNQSEIFVMKHSMGGTSIDPLGATEYHWTADYEFLDSPSHSLLRTFEATVRKGVETQGTNFDIKAMLWHQGEGDMQNESVASRYYENLKNMLAYVRGVVGNPRLYFFCGNISLNRTSPGYVEIINAAYTKLASEDPYFKVVDMSNAQLEDGYHFNYQWSIYFGQKVYDLMIDAGIISGTKINPSEPS